MVIVLLSFKVLLSQTYVLGNVRSELFLVYGCQLFMFYVVFVCYNRHLYFYLFYLIKEFLEINMPSDVDPQILWETTKCAIRGFCISFSSTLAKAKTHQFTQLENKIQTLQNLQKQHFTGQQATQLSSLKEEYDYFHNQRWNLFYIGLGKNIILNQRDLVIYCPLGWKNASLRHILAQ